MSIDFNPIAKELHKLPDTNTPLFGALEQNVNYVFAGKSAIALLLRYWRNTGMLRNRTDQMLVPHWLGTPVYEVMHKQCFPTTADNDRARGIMAYHQWGYPQRMDVLMEFARTRGLFVMEDCAHSFESYWQGQRVGTIGDAGVFSLSKFFPSVVGGAIYTASPLIRDYVHHEQARDDSELAQKIFTNRLAFDQLQTRDRSIALAQDYIIYGEVVSCPPYALAASRHSVAENAVEKRKKIYKQYAEVFGTEPMLAELLKEDVVPWVVPIFAGEKCAALAQALQVQGVHTSVYHFDINRTMLEPRFVPCVPLPCHQELTDEEVHMIISTAKAVL